MNFADQTDHKVAMSVQVLATSALELYLFRKEAEALPYLASDRGTIEAAHGLLGKLLEQFPANQNEATTKWAK